MSETNGAVKPATLAEAREEFRRERLLARTAELRAQRQLLEHWCGDNFMAPVGVPGYTSDGWRVCGPNGRPEDRRQGDGGPALADEDELDRQRGVARVLCETNGMAIGALRTLQNFTVRTGFRYRCEAEPEAEDSNAAELAAAVQVAVDEFRDLNDFSRREKRGFWRSRRDGDLFWRYFARHDGATLIRVVDPERVRAPQGTSDPSWSWGVRTDPDDVETVLGYCVDGSEVPASDVDHLKLNVDESIKRGVSDFFCVGEEFDGVRKLLRNMRVGEGIRAAIPWLYEYETANREGVQRAIDAARDRLQPGADPTTGRAMNFQRFEPGTIPHVPKGKKFVAPPASQAIASQTGVVQACLRSVGCRWNMAEYMISGDASNNAFASALVAGSPFVVSIETEQDEYRTFYLGAVWRAVDNYARAGRFRANGTLYGPEDVRRLVQIICEIPPVPIVDRLQRAQTKEIELRNEITSKQQWRGEVGNDNDQVRQDLVDDPVQQPAAFPSPVGGLGATPPGSGPIGLGSAPTVGGTPAAAPASPDAANSLRAKVGGSQAVAELQRAYYAGELPREAAISNARLVFGFSSEDAEQLFPETAPVKLTPPTATPTQEGRHSPFAVRLN